MKFDIHYWGSLIVLLFNIVALYHITNKSGVYNFKALRIVILIAVLVGVLDTFGQVTVLSVLFAFTPALSLINTTANGSTAQKFRLYLRTHLFRKQNIQRNNKTVSKQA